MKAISTLPAQAPAKIDPEALLMRAVESGQGVDTLERLIVLRERLQAEFAASQYRAALLDFQSECPKIEKGQEVKDKSGDVRYRYAPLEAIMDVAEPIEHRHGFAHDFDTTSEAGAVTVIMTVSHIAGHERKTQFRVPIDPKSYMTEPQKYEAAMSFAQRICYRNAFGIVTGTNDNNTEEPATPPAPPPAPAPPQEPPIGAGSPAHKAIEARIEELGLNREGVKTWCSRNLNVEHFPDLTVAQQRTLMASLPGMVVTKLKRQIPLMTASDLEALIESPPDWLRASQDAGSIMEVADARLTHLRTTDAATWVQEFVASEAAAQDLTEK